MRFEGKVFLVTGGARGIGRAIVQRLVEEGGRVCLLDVDRRAGADTARALGERVRFSAGSVAREPDVRRAVAGCVRWGGRLDGVVNDAGIADRGSIVQIASTRALQSEPDTEPYAACKGGLVALTHALAISLGPTTRVNCVSPGWIVTGAQRVSRRDHAQHPVGRAGRPDDIAGLTAWLLSDEAAFVTGQNFVADGGMTRKMIYA